MNTPAPAPTTSAAAATAAPSKATSGGLTFKDWEEHPVGPQDSFPRLARARVTNSLTGAVTAPATTCEYTIAYTGENVGTFAGMERVTGTVGGREGGFVLEERGTFDAAGTRCHFEVVPGSATSGLTGLTGSGSFVHRHGDTAVAYIFTYDLP